MPGNERQKSKREEAGRCVEGMIGLPLKYKQGGTAKGGASSPEHLSLEIIVVLLHNKNFFCMSYSLSSLGSHFGFEGCRDHNNDVDAF